MKKTIFTLNINDYSPEITNITYPFIDAYARKIGADLQIITTRKYPDYPIPYEKFQIYDLATDWNIYIDSDALIHPDTFDVTELLPEDTVLTARSEFAPIHFNYDRFFKRDNRHIYAGNWFTVASKLCIDIWHPLDDLPLVQAVCNIHPTLLERNRDITSAHLLDDYVLSRNIAKFGLKYKTFTQILEEQGNPGEFLYHEYLYSEKEKVVSLKKVLQLWRDGKTTP